MPRLARVTSTDAVQRMSTSLKTFAEEATGALAELEMQINRIAEWIGHDRRQYWENQVRNGWQEVSEARAALERARLKRIGDEHRECREEKALLDRAKRRLAEAQEKVQVVRRWTIALEQECREFRGNVSQLATWLQAEFPRAAAGLDRMVRALDTYVAVGALPDSMATAGLIDDGSPATASRGSPAEEPAAEVPAPKESEHEELGPLDRSREAGSGDGEASGGEN
jgi:hypothetical protein